MSKEIDPPTRRRILLVEDDLDEAHLVKFLLEGDGDRYTVTLAQDGLRGSLLVRDSHWDLVITDLNLPGADGMAVVEASREHQPDTPILATTGYTDPEYGDRALELGANAVLIKPLERDELRDRVRKLIEAREESDEPPEEEPESEPPAPQFQVLALSVRPGDAEVGIGATLLRHLEAGHRVILVTLTHGSDEAEGDRRKEEAKAAGRSMGAHFFVGKAGSGDQPLEKELRRLVRGAIDQVRPDLLYVPTVHHPTETHRIVHETAVGEKQECPIFAYDPGDAAPGFAPDRFVVVDGTLDRKLEVIGTYNAADGEYLAPESVRLGARFWGRFAEGAPAEPLETVRGKLPDELSDGSLLPSRTVPLE